jgi:hypothetical protein
MLWVWRWWGCDANKKNAPLIITHASKHTKRIKTQTRAQTRGAPLKKEGAYDTDKYYQEKDQGYGDVGV